jgi:anti-sigma B factor antagonist
MQDPKKSKLVIQSVGDITTVTLTDARILDENTVKTIAEELTRLVKETFKMKLLIDFSNVEYLSSAVLGKLVATYKLVQEGKGTMKLCSIKPAIRQVFSITKLDKMFEIHDDQGGAIKAFTTKKFGIF